MGPLRYLTLASLTLSFAAQPVAGQHAWPTSDTLAARDSARLAAKKDPVVLHFMAGFVGAPATVVALLVLSEGDTPEPGMAVGPALLAIASHAASKPHPLPPELEMHLHGKHPLYARVYRRTYDSAVSKRRGTAAAFGGLTGVVAGIAFLAYAFSGGG